MDVVGVERANVLGTGVVGDGVVRAWAARGVVEEAVVAGLVLRELAC